MTDQTNDNSVSHKRRNLLGIGGVLAGVALAPQLASAAAAKKNGVFPAGFLWGAAIAGHQAEGDNVNSDAWALENTKPTEFKEPSGSAVDHYRLYDQDIAMLASLGLNTFRFSIEWARVEPVQGMFSVAAIEHYRDVLEACRKRGIKAMVSFNHFVTPAWFAARGGWEAEGSPELFARYCDHVAQKLGHMMYAATTFNEPNLAKMLFGIPGPLQGMSKTAREKEMLANAGKAFGTGKWSSWIFGDFDKIQDNMMIGHELGYKAIKAHQPKLPVGLSMAIIDEQAVGDPAMRDKKRAIAYEPWFRKVGEVGDFLGVQTYSRGLIGPDGELPPPKGAEMTEGHMEFYPQALEATIRYSRQHVNKPIYVTENGIATNDDTRRIAYIDTALKGVANCLKDGIDVRGYIHWSLLDNFEWIFGYGMRYGLIDVDRATMKRTVKPSARLLGKIARANGI